MNQQKDNYGFGAEHFVALLLASLTLGHITVDTRLRFAQPKLGKAGLHMSAER